MTSNKIIVIASVLILAGAAFADSEAAVNYSSVEEYALAAIGNQNRIIVKQATLPTRLVVGVAHTEGRRRIDTCCTTRPSRQHHHRAGVPSTLYGNDKAGLISVFKASNFKASKGHLTLVESSKVFSLPSNSSVMVGAYASEVAIAKPDRFTVRMECHQCTDSVVGLWGSIIVRFHFAFREGRWVVSGWDREISKVVGSTPSNPGAQQKTLISGVVERASHNYRTGQRRVESYSFDEVKSRMKLVSKVSTQKEPLRISLHDFDPAHEILGQAR